MHTLIVLLAMLVPLISAAPARAASCFPAFVFALPSEGAAAPRNTRVWLSSSSDSSEGTYRWHDSEGAAVRFSVKRLPVAGGVELVVLSPEEPLRASATYEVEVWSEQDSVESCVHKTMFNTFDEIDDEPPALPHAEEWMRTAHDGEFGKQRSVSFTVEGDAVVIADANGEGLDSPLEDDGARLAVVTTRPELTIGHGVCVSRNIDGDQADVRFGTFDLAGNFSGYTEPQHVKLPELDGCALGTRTGGGWAALLVAAAMLRKRARRKARG